MTANAKTGITVGVLCAAFLALTALFLSDSGGTAPAPPVHPAGGHQFPGQINHAAAPTRIWPGQGRTCRILTVMCVMTRRRRRRCDWTPTRTSWSPRSMSVPRPFPRMTLAPTHGRGSSADGRPIPIRYPLCSGRNCRIPSRPCSRITSLRKPFQSRFRTWFCRL